MEQTLRLLNSLGVDVSGLNAEDAGAIQRAVDKVLTDDIKSKVTDLEAKVEAAESSKKELEATIETLTDEKAELETANTDLTAKNDTFEAAETEREARVEAKKSFEDAKLPERLISPVFIEMYLSASDEDKPKLIEDRLAMATAGDDEEIDLGLSREEREVAAKGGDNDKDPWLDNEKSCAILLKSAQEARTLGLQRNKLKLNYKEC